MATLTRTEQGVAAGYSVANINVTIALAGGTSISGSTDSAGVFRFVYVPPRSGTTAQLTATCQACINTASQAVTVAGATTPDMCMADAGSLMGNPVSPSTGEKIETESDFADSGAHPLHWTRHYRSYGNLAAGLGNNWSHAYAGLMTGFGDQRTVLLGDGGRVTFNRASAASPWVAENGEDQLTENSSGWVYTRARDESRWQLDTPGARLQSITSRNGWTQALTYGSNGKLSAITNAFGRQIQLVYDVQDRLSIVGLPDGSAIWYQYDNAQRLIGASFSDGTSKSYGYDNPQWPGALTRTVDERGQTLGTYTYDSAGRAVGSTHAGGAQSFGFNYGNASSAPTGSLVAGDTIDLNLYRATVQVTDPLGNPQTWTYQGGDGTIRVLGANGAFMGGQVANRSFVAASTLPESETDFLGITTLFSWDTSRRLKTAVTRAASRPEAQTVQTQWHPSLRLPVLVTEPGRSTAYAYDANGNTLSETTTDTATGEARTWAWTYNPQGLPATQTDPLGGVWNYSYDAAGNRTLQRNPLGHETRWAYDGAGRVTRQTDPNGLVTQYQYDLRGRLTQVNRNGEISTYAWTPSGQLASATQPNGHSVNYSYDAAQRLIGASDNRGNSVAYTLDGLGNRTREEVRDATGAMAQVTSRTINSLNKVAAISGALGQTTQLGYDANGEPVSATDPLNQTTRQSLDALRRPTATTLADNAVASQAWNSLNQLTQVTDPKGVATSYSRNAFGEVTSEASPDSGTTVYQRDRLGQVISQTDARGITTLTSRDALGRPLEVRRGPNGAAAATHITRYTWDTQQTGYLAKMEDPSGETRLERDTNGRLLTRTQLVNDNPANPAQFVTRYAHTSAGVLSDITYPSGLKVFYRRNTAGQLVGLDTQVPGRNKPVTPFVSNLTHTALGQPKAWSWVNGDSAARSFDADGRMVSNEVASYTYDPAGRITALTQNLWASLTLTTVQGTQTVTTTQMIQAPLGWDVAYDSRNRVIEMRSSRQAPPPLIPGRMAVRSESQITSGFISRYVWDANSNRTAAVDTTTADIDLDGQYETTDLQTTVSQEPAIATNSNRLLGFGQTMTRVRGTRTLSMATTSVTYTLDAVGNLTSDGLRTFEYDEANRPSVAKVFKDGEEARIRSLHNAWGQRVFKGEPEASQTLPSETTLGQSFIDWLKSNFRWMFEQAQANTSIGTAYIYDEDGSLLGEYDNGSAKAAGRTEYIWLPTENGQQAGQPIPVGIFRNGNFFAIHSDHLGTPRLMTNEDNKPVWQWPYSAFGANKPTGILQATPNPRVAITNQPVLLKATAATELNLRFPGQYFDSETNLHYNYFRSYQPNQGRYTQGDPIGLDGGLNRFGYVEGNALMFIDPTGLCWVYEQSTGRLFRAGNNPSATTFVGEGYAGNGLGLNNAELEIIQNRGPLPRGRYTIGRQGTIVTQRGTELQSSMRLIPDRENWMYDRAGFLIHGGNMQTRQSSNGCIVMPKSIRDQIGASGDACLKVVQ